MKKVVLLTGSALALGLTFLVVILLSSMRPTLDTEALAVADRLLAAGNPQEALAIYQQLSDQGQPSSALYFNMGNAHYQQGDLPAAYAAYLQSLDLAPRDADIRHNLALVEQQLSANPSPDAELLMDRLPLSWLTTNEVALLGLAVWYVVCFLGLLLWLYNRPRPEKRRNPVSSSAH